MTKETKQTTKIFWMVLIMFAALNVFAGSAFADEYDTLRDKWKKILTGGTLYNSSDPDIAGRITIITSTAQTAWSTLNTSPSRTYLWSDAGSTTLSTDITINYNRLRDMALAYETTGSTLYGNATLLNDIKSALDWLNTNRYNASTVGYDNWFAWEIGIPLALNDIVVLLYNNLSTTQRTNYMNAVDHFSPIATWAGSSTSTGSNSTGANRILKCEVVVIRGILVKSSTKIAAARDAMSPPFDYVTGFPADGFYEDGSFRQHSWYAYTLGYGTGVFGRSINLVYLLSGSTWAVTDPDSANIYNWAYKSFEPAIYKGSGMDMLTGRNMSREAVGNHTTGHSVIDAFVRLAQYAPAADALKFKKMAKEWITTDSYLSYYSRATIDLILLAKQFVNDPGIPARGELSAHYRFPMMDRAIHLRPGFAFGLSMSSFRVYNYESLNGENLKGWYTGDGMTYLYNGDLGQFDDHFWPTVNSYRLPGTTVDTMARSAGDGTNYQSPYKWTGGSDILGLYGVTGMNYKQYNSTLNAKKSWFMFDDEIVALGSGITKTSGASVVETNVEQRKLNASGNNILKVNGTTKSAALGWSETMTGVNWIHLAGSVSGSDTGYYFPTAATIKGLREARNGSWSGINTFGSTTNQTRNYLNLRFDHGTLPTNQTYAYALLPNKTSTEMSNYSSSPDFTVLENSTDAHGVKENVLKITAVNFWNDIVKTVGAITTNKIASVMLHEGVANEFEVAVSDPWQTNSSTITITIDRAATSVISKDSQITVVQYSPTLILSVNVNGSKGKTFRAKFNSKQLITTADTFVQDGKNANTNNGTAVISITKDGVAGYDREAFLKFNLSSLSGTITSAKLIFNAAVSDGGGTSVNTNLHQVTTDTWTETGLTWNNKPAKGSLISTLNINNVYQWRQIDVTSYVQSQINGDKTASFVLAQNLANAGLLVGIKTREAMEQPYLLIQ